MLSEQIVRRAMDLLMELPEAPAMQILDLAMQGVSGHISFENLDPRTRMMWGDHLDPPSPFAELVRRAFAPRLDPYAWMLMASESGIVVKYTGEQLNQADLDVWEKLVHMARDQSHDQAPKGASEDQQATVLNAWQDALERFGSRYQLWGD
jgi:hypothetical protein